MKKKHKINLVLDIVIVAGITLILGSVVYYFASVRTMDRQQKNPVRRAESVQSIAARGQSLGLQIDQSSLSGAALEVVARTQAAEETLSPSASATPAQNQDVPIVAPVVENKPVDEDIKVTSPAPNAEFQTQILISGEAKGSWYFEATFPIRLEDGAGKVLASTMATAQSDWQSAEMVPFKAEITYEADKPIDATLVFQNDNPSGMIENQKEFRQPVKLIPVSKTNPFQIFFSMADSLAADNDCTKVFPVTREVPKTQAMARAAIDDLLNGPTPAETEKGYMTGINPGVKVQKLVIVDGVLKVDFDKKLEEAVGGSCRVLMIRSQIEKTLGQFPTVKKVVISINGRTEDILQP